MNFHPIENSSDTAEICVPILMDMYSPKSVLDLGCNTGWWLHWFIKHGVNDIMGVDGVNMINNLNIPLNKFMCMDLTKKIDLGRKFDLVMCLEVAEHLEERHADRLINTATTHGDIIFWSAATVGQGGYNHVNEQPHEYWIEKFKERGYYSKLLCDVLPPLPHDYYRKNAIQFIRL